VYDVVCFPCELCLERRAFAKEEAQELERNEIEMRVGMGSSSSLRVGDMSPSGGTTSPNGNSTDSSVGFDAVTGGTDLGT